MKKNNRKKIIVFLLFFSLSGCSQSKNESSSTEQISENSSTTMLKGDSTTSLPPIDLENIEGVEYLTITSRGHTEEDLDYPTVPPAGGDHLGIWHNCGEYVV